MAFNFLWLELPGEQPAGNLPVAKSALFIAINGLISPSYLRQCPCDGRCFREDVEERYYQLANFATAILGLALLLLHMAFSATVFRSPLFPPVARWLVWLTKVLTCATLQFGLHILHFCLKMLYVRLMLVLA